MALATTTLEQQARYLAKESREAHDDVHGILWFPAADEIRLIILTTDVDSVGDVMELPAFYFSASPEDGLDFSSATALIRPEERGRLRLPARWGTWSDAVEL